MRGAERMRLEDITRGTYPPEGPPVVSPRLKCCVVCGGARDYSGLASTSACVNGVDQLCFGCGLWALGFDHWDDDEERQAAESLAASMRNLQQEIAAMSACPPLAFTR